MIVRKSVLEDLVSSMREMRSAYSDLISHIYHVKAIGGKVFGNKSDKKETHDAEIYRWTSENHVGVPAKVSKYIREVLGSSDFSGDVAIERTVRILLSENGGVDVEVIIKGTTFVKLYESERVLRLFEITIIVDSDDTVTYNTEIPVYVTVPLWLKEKLTYTVKKTMIWSLLAFDPLILEEINKSVEEVVSWIKRNVQITRECIHEIDERVQKLKKEFALHEITKGSG